MAVLERIQQARQTDLVEWLRVNNEPLKRAGQWWYIEGSDSLRIQGNKWYRNSQNKGGNAIDFLVDYYGLTTKEAIDRLVQTAGHNAYKNSGVKEKNKKTRPIAASGFDFNAIHLARNQRRVLAYLAKTRGISANIALAEIQKGRLFQESQTGNAIFAMTNEAGDIVGAEVTGTLSFENIRFKGLKAGSAAGYGFNVGHTRDPCYILYFESAVDLLSFITITHNRGKHMAGCLLVSMAGLRPDVVQNTPMLFGISAASPVLCVDNDEAGNEFIANCITRRLATIVRRPDNRFKDWNDQLRGVEQFI